jgi:hypothetical protein
MNKRVFINYFKEQKDDHFTSSFITVCNANFDSALEIIKESKAKITKAVSNSLTEHSKEDEFINKEPDETVKAKLNKNRTSVSSFNCSIDRIKTSIQNSMFFNIIQISLIGLNSAIGEKGIYNGSIIAARKAIEMTAEISKIRSLTNEKLSFDENHELIQLFEGLVDTVTYFIGRLSSNLI